MLDNIFRDADLHKEDILIEHAALIQPFHDKWNKFAE